MAVRGPRYIALACVAIAALCIPAAAAAERPATTVVGADGQPLKRETGWAHGSAVPLPPGKITVRFADCPRYPRFDACVQSWRPRTIWMKPGLYGARAVFLHEVGHVFDMTVLRNGDRASFKRIHGHGSRWWRGAQPPAEWFADAYSLCARRRSLSKRPAVTNYGYAPTPARHAATCRLLGRIGKRLDGAPLPPPDPPAETPPVVTDIPTVAPAPSPPQQWKPYRCALILTCYGRP